MRPVAASTRSARPVHCAMLPRWQSSTLFAPSSIGWLTGAPVRTRARKFAMCSAVHHPPPATALDRIGIAAQPLPRDRPAAVELERRLLRVGELPVVVEMVAAAGGRAAHR